MKKIVEFWNECSLKGPRYVHPDDLRTLEKYSKRSLDLQTFDFQGFLKSDRFGNFEDSDFHLSLIPTPYIGDLANADIFVLQLNPGMHFGDYYAECCMPEFKRLLEANLRQDFRNVEFPFIYLDPQFCWHCGFAFWERKFREVATEIAQAKFNECYSDALRDLSKRVAVLELVPYHSVAFRAQGALRDLPSAAQARRFAQVELAHRAEDDKATVIITRQVGNWKLPKTKNVCHYEGGSQRGASLGKKTLGGKAILAWYAQDDTRMREGKL